MKTSTPAGFVTHRTGNDFLDKQLKAGSRKAAEDALPKHPIVVPNRFKVLVNKVYPLGEYERLIPGKEYNVDIATKTQMEKDGVLKVATPA